MSSAPSINQKISVQIKTAVEEFNLIQPGDKILVGLSGGKDSLLLVHQLSEIMVERNFNFKVLAAHIKFDNLPYGIDAEYLSNFCEQRKVEYHLIEDNIRDAYLENDHKETCIHCSRFRRAKLMELARIFNCNKLTLGHHLDDIVATLIMNMTHHGRFGGMALKLDISVGKERYPLTLIRPLAYTPENDIIEFNKVNEFQPAKCRCPWGDTGVRSKTRQAVDFIVSELGEEARLNMFRSQFNLTRKMKPINEQTKDIKDKYEEISVDCCCSSVGNPTGDIEDILVNKNLKKLV